MPPQYSALAENLAPVAASKLSSLKAPVPVGRPSSVVPVSKSAGVMTVCGFQWHTLYGNWPSGPSSVIFTVRSSTAVQPPGSM